MTTQTKYQKNKKQTNKHSFLSKKEETNMD